MCTFLLAHFAGLKAFHHGAPTTQFSALDKNSNDQRRLTMVSTVTSGLFENSVCVVMMMVGWCYASSGNPGRLIVVVKSPGAAR
eukprot:scaffold5156_cov92-Skeletonema_dohrnii-CCMP3373.AAC.1